MINLQSNSLLFRRRVSSPPYSAVPAAVGQHRLKIFGELSDARTVIALVVISALFRLFLIGSQSLWYDEGISLAMTDSKTIYGTIEAMWLVNGGDKYQPVYFILLALWRAVVGEGQVTLQLLSVLFGIITPALLYLSIKPLFGYRHAVCSALFLVCSAFCVSYSQEVRPYSFLLFLAAGQLLLFSPALNRKPASISRVTAFSIITLISCISSVFLMLFSIVMAVSFLAAYRDVKQCLRWWGPASLAAIPAIVYFGYTPAATDLSTDAINTTNVAIWQNAIFSIYGHLAGYSYGPAISSLRTAESILLELSNHVIALVALIVVSCILAVNTLKIMVRPSLCSISYAVHMFFMCLMAFSLAIAFAVAVLTSINWMPRHSFYLMLPLAVLLPASLFNRPGVRAGSEGAQKANISSAVAFAGLLLINVLANVNYYFDSSHWRDDYRSAAAFLNGRVDQGDASFMLWGEPYLLNYYGHTSIEGLRALEDANLINSRIADAIATKNDVYVSFNRETSWQRYSATLDELIFTTYELIPEAQFNSFSIYRIKLKRQWLTTGL